ncbi:MAG: hypothetical protein ACK5FE_13955, partial [Cyanobacteriota bacterium]
MVHTISCPIGLDDQLVEEVAGCLGELRRAAQPFHDLHQSRLGGKPQGAAAGIAARQRCPAQFSEAAGHLFHQLVVEADRAGDGVD